MEISEDGFLEELLALRRSSEPWDQDINTTNTNNHPSSSSSVSVSVSDQINGFFSATSWPFDGLDSTPGGVASTMLPNNPTSYDNSSIDPSSFTDFYPNPSLISAVDQIDWPGSAVVDHVPSTDHGTCKTEPPTTASSFSIGLCMGNTTTSSNHNNVHSNSTTTTNNCTISNGSKNINSNGNSNYSSGKSKVKKIEGQPSKNLMAERRRRKRLNDRLSMLRSVVPKISKMDRTSILGDTIDYMKELLERINSLQEEMEVGSSDQVNVMGIFKDVKPSDVLVRNSPKFDVERRNMDTRVEICCGGKPGLLLSTVTTLEALGLEIQQCVISCFNDFSLQASCSEEMEQKILLSSEDIKQALFRNAGYGGRCL